MTKLIVPGLLATTLFFSPAAANPGPQDTALTKALVDLHDARFDAAQASLQSMSGADSRPEILFFRAFVTYWRLIYDSDNLELRRALEKELSNVIARADAGRAEDPTVALWAGNARLLLAQLRAIQKKSLGAAMEAKRARKELNSLDAEGPVVAESLFGLGTYNYMADRVPSFVKGLRSLLFIPPGDRDLGLRQLERAARESRWFSVEARLLLVTIASNRHERRYRDALAQASRARGESPESLVVAHAVAKLFLSLGRWDKAEEVLDPALARAHALHGVDPTVAGVLELQRARLDFARFRPDLAGPRASALLEVHGHLATELRENARQLAATSKALTSKAWWPEAKAHALGNGAAMNAVSPASSSAERSAVMALLEGRSTLAAGRAEEGLRLLAQAESSGALPEAWLGACRLLAGQAADLAGSRERAIAYYKRAESTPGFIAREAAIDYQARPFKAGSE